MLLGGLDLLRSEDDTAAMDTDADFGGGSQDPTAALQEQLEYAVNCLKGWGCPVDLGDRSPRAVSSADPRVLSLVVSGLVEALRRGVAEREQQQDATCRLQSDLRVLQSVRRRLEEEKEASGRELGSMKNKLQMSEEQYKRQLKESEAQREALARQLKEAKQRQVQHEHALRKRDIELEQAQRQLQGAALRRTVSLGHGSAAAAAAAAPAMQPPYQQQQFREAGPRREPVRQELGGGSGGGGVGAGGGDGSGRSNSQAAAARRGGQARRVTAPAVRVGSAEVLAQRVSELEQELEVAQEGQEAAAEQLHSLLARADNLGFGPALRAVGGSSRDAGSRAGFGAQGTADLGLDQGLDQGQMLEGLADLQGRCRRWQDDFLTGGWAAAATVQSLRQLKQHLEDAAALMQEQAQALSSASHQYRQQQDNVASLEAHIMALDARLQAALMHGSAPLVPPLHSNVHQRQHAAGHAGRHVLHRHASGMGNSPAGSPSLQQGQGLGQGRGLGQGQGREQESSPQAAGLRRAGGVDARGAGCGSPPDVRAEARRRSLSAPGGGGGLTALGGGSGLTAHGGGSGGGGSRAGVEAGATGEGEGARREVDGGQGAGGGVGGVTPPPGRKMWSRSALASPKMQLRSSMMWLGEGEEEGGEGGGSVDRAGARGSPIGSDGAGGAGGSDGAGRSSPGGGTGCTAGAAGGGTGLGVLAERRRLLGRASVDSGVSIDGCVAAAVRCGDEDGQEGVRDEERKGRKRTGMGRKLRAEQRRLLVRASVDSGVSIDGCTAAAAPANEARRRGAANASGATAVNAPTARDRPRRVTDDATALATACRASQASFEGFGAVLSSQQGVGQAQRRVRAGAGAGMAAGAGQGVGAGQGAGQGAGVRGLGRPERVRPVALDLAHHLMSTGLGDSSSEEEEAADTPSLKPDVGSAKPW